MQAGRPECSDDACMSGQLHHNVPDMGHQGPTRRRRTYAIGSCGYEWLQTAVCRELTPEALCERPQCGELLGMSAVSELRFELDLCLDSGTIELFEEAFLHNPVQDAVIDHVSVVESAHLRRCLRVREVIENILNRGRQN